GYEASYGSFGKGGSSNLCGGGGWFGGAGAYFGDVAGGGSGYALTKDSYKPPGYIPTSEYWLENVVMTAGGNTTKADGYAKITLLQTLPFLEVSSYNSTTATFKADHTDPTLLTKIEYFIDDTLKETITTDLTLEKTINYTLEDNALHTLKIVVTDSNNATAEKVLSISKGIAPLPAGSTTDEVTNKWIEIKDAFKTGKTSIINTLALKNIEASLNNTLVELSEKIKVGFDSKDASLQDLIKQLTQSNNTISQLNTKYKVASGTVEYEKNNNSVAKKYLVNGSYKPNYITNLTNFINFIPNLVLLECETAGEVDKSRLYKEIVIATNFLHPNDFIAVICESTLNVGDKLTLCRNNTYDFRVDKTGIILPVQSLNSVIGKMYNWYAIKFI
ncbi:TPA: hypothetical protein KOS16_003185, partial [Clostridioides difficile]|nr:hypothetical protein [Clostridioides difficile]